LLGEIIHTLPLVEAFSGKVAPVCRDENAYFNNFRVDGFPAAGTTRRSIF
jgi:hypothetical protein